MRKLREVEHTALRLNKVQLKGKCRLAHHIIMQLCVITHAKRDFLKLSIINSLSTNVFLLQTLYFNLYFITVMFYYPICFCWLIPR